MYTCISVPCGICQNSIKSNSVAHGHRWIHQEFDGYLFDLFHRTCIQERLTNGTAHCPNCTCKVINAVDYNAHSDLSRARLLFQENRTIFLTFVKERNFPALKHLLHSVKTIPDTIQMEAVEIAVEQNDPKMARKILFKPQCGVHPASLSLLLNIAARSGFDAIIQVFLEYNSVYLRRTEAPHFKTFQASDIHIAAQFAISNGHFSGADLLLNAQYSLNPDMWKDLFYLSIDHGYWEGIRKALSFGIPKEPEVLEKGLLLAARKGYSGIVLALLHTEDANLLNLAPPLLDAISKGYPRTGYILLKRAGLLDPTVRSTAVQLAASQGFEELLAALIQNGPIFKEARYWAQTCSKNQACLDILSNAVVY